MWWWAPSLSSPAMLQHTPPQNLGSALKANHQPTQHVVVGQKKSGYKPKSEDATGIISFSQQFLSGTSTSFFWGCHFLDVPRKLRRKGSKRLDKCVSWARKRPALWVFWIPQGCTKMMFYITKKYYQRYRKLGIQLASCHGSGHSIRLYHVPAGFLSRWKKSATTEHHIPHIFWIFLSHVLSMMTPS